MLLSLGFSTLVASSARSQTTTDLKADLKTVSQVGPEASGHDAAIDAAKRLSGQPADSVASILAAMKDASPLGKNWLRLIAADVADNDTFPRELLLQFLNDRSQDTDSRHAAFQLLTTEAPELKATLLADATDDPSLPIRHLAIASVLEKAAALKDSDKQAAEKWYRLVVAQGRNPDQLQAAVKALSDLGQEVVLADELGLIRRWWAIGTFDNTNSEHFNTAYLPEQTYEKEGRLPATWLEESATVIPAADKREPVKTSLIKSDDFQGVVNINPAFDNAKDAIAYVYVEFDLPKESSGKTIDAVARLGCITASKVWVNGKLSMANEVYHSGTRIDQYLGDCKLNPGRNSVLIKLCQNAQTEPWAQDWQFQFRITDPVGGAIKPAATVEP
jgi:hypothetical protein